MGNKLRRTSTCKETGLYSRREEMGMGYVDGCFNGAGMNAYTGKLKSTELIFSQQLLAEIRQAARTQRAPRACSRGHGGYGS